MDVAIIPKDWPVLLAVVKHLGYTPLAEAKAGIQMSNIRIRKPFFDPLEFGATPCIGSRRNIYIHPGTRRQVELDTVIRIGKRLAICLRHRTRASQKQEKQHKAYLGHRVVEGDK